MGERGEVEWIRVYDDNELGKVKGPTWYCLYLSPFDCYLSPFECLMVVTMVLSAMGGGKEGQIR